MGRLSLRGQKLLSGAMRVYMSGLNLDAYDLRANAPHYHMIGAAGRRTHAREELHVAPPVVGSPARTPLTPEREAASGQPSAAGATLR